MKYPVLYETVPGKSSGSGFFITKFDGDNQ